MTNKTLGVFTLAMINVSAIVSLRNLPMMAIHGLSSLFFYAIAGLLFFVPCALVLAELASGWPEHGGVYAWVKAAFGERLAFLAIWLEWIESVVWLPTALSFVAGTTAYLIDPLLADNKYFLFGTMMAILWPLTFLNFLEVRTSSWVSTLGVIFGTLLLGALIIGLAAFWILSGHPIAMPVSTEALVPDMHFDNLVFIAGVFLSFAGMEVASYHAREARNPKRDYPRAIGLATVIILGISVLGALSIASVLPNENISLVSGLMQAFDAYFSEFGLRQWVPTLAGVALAGAFALLNSWILGPSKGLVASAQAGNLPKIFAYENKFGSPVNILFAQAIFGTLLGLLFIFMPSVNSSYWVLTVMATQLIIMMYVLIFLSAIVLRKKAANQERPYRIPGGNWGMYLTAGTGIASSVFAFFVGFVPPHDMGITQPGLYSLSLMLGVLTLAVLPLGYAWRTRR